MLVRLLLCLLPYYLFVYLFSCLFSCLLLCCFVSLSICFCFALSPGSSNQTFLTSSNLIRFQLVPLFRRPRLEPRPQKKLQKRFCRDSLGDGFLLGWNLNQNFFGVAWKPVRWWNLWSAVWPTKNPVKVSGAQILWTSFRYLKPSLKDGPFPASFFVLIFSF